ncbi:MAG: FAD-binding protein [Planctomycetes bacterium]|nr:FAD-binding protein [Planctomycetota bacterium]MCP4772028.1 FAD-binding protein [Planctomycetota bacterium]MCP4860232.1 FAD-binding protein [Planctomycetota bacterium]
MSSSLVLLLTPEQDPETLTPEQLLQLASEALECSVDDLEGVRIKRISFDARVRHMLWNVAVEVWHAGEEMPPVAKLEPPKYDQPAADAKHVIVVGSGPAGLFCALDLIAKGVRVTVCERGKAVQDRRKDIANLNRGEDTNPESNYAFGEGGAGTFSDGKLYTRSSKRANIQRVLETLVAHGAPERILIAWRPHIGSNMLPRVVTAICDSIREAGSEVRFDTRVDAMLTNDDASIRGVRLADGTELEANAVVLATGHSALDALQMAQDAGAKLEAKGFAMGVRVEHPQDWLDNIQYRGTRMEHSLPPSFYELSAQIHERGVFSFCMCPGGWIVPSQSTPSTLVVNGMSMAKRDSPYANSGLVVSIEPKDWCGKRGWRWGWPELLQHAAKLSEHPLLHEVIEDPRGGEPFPVAEGRLPIHPDIDPLFGVRLQLAMEVVAADAGGGEGRAPAQRCDLYAEASEDPGEVLPTSYLPGLTPTNLHGILPRGVATRLREALWEFEEHLPGFAGAHGQLVGVETRTSSPVRIERDADSLQSPTVSGLYPCGEGAGFAGGIVSAAMDGARIAAAITSE